MPSRRIRIRSPWLGAVAALVVAVALPACGGSNGAAAGDGAGSNVAGADSGGLVGGDDSVADVAAGDGFVGTGVLTVSLDDGRSFEFVGDCEIVIDSAWKHVFAFDDPDAGQLATASHTESLDGTEIGFPTSLQFSDADSWLYRGTEFTSTSRTDSSWSTDVVLEGAIDNEPFRQTASATSTCN